MDLDRDWTPFALDAEVEVFGTGRIAKEHNSLRARLAAAEGSLEAIFGKAHEHGGEDALSCAACHEILGLADDALHALRSLALPAPEPTTKEST